MHAPARIWRGALPRACLFTEASLGQELDLQVGFESLVNIRMQRFVMSGRCGQLRKSALHCGAWHYAKRGGASVTPRSAAGATRAGRGKPRATYNTR